MNTVQVQVQPELLKDGTKNPNAGKVLTIHEESGWGRIMLKQDSFEIVNNVFRDTTRYAFISFPPEDIESGAKRFKAGMTLPGVIQKRQSPTPLFKDHEQAINPQTGEAMGYYLDYIYNGDPMAPTFIEIDHAQVAAEKEKAKQQGPSVTPADINA